AAGAIVRNAAAGNKNAIGHIIVIVNENHSFDNLYGMFPGANGISQAKQAPKQVDKNGKPYETLPQPINDYAQPKAAPDDRFPKDLPNEPFLLNQFVKPGDSFGAAEHKFYEEQDQADGGKMDKFVATPGGTAGLVMGYWDTTQLPMYDYASKFTLMDNFFHGAWGESFFNNLWLMCACVLTFPNAPADMLTTVDAGGKVLKENKVTPDGYAINDHAISVYGPHDAETPNAAHLVPPQTLPTIGDRLNEKNVSWAWYAGGWNDALAGKPDPTFRNFHQPFIYFKNFGDGTDQKKLHLKDESDFLNDLKDGNVPAVSYLKPLGADDEHPGYTTVFRGEQHTVGLIQAIQASPIWKDSVIIVTYDESGGLYDHVAPPKGDRWGPGPRIPAILVSPLVKQGFIDHSQSESTSVLAFIEWRFGLSSLGTRDATVSDLTSALQLPS
ncbi:MAG TPA: alkaline phosphatase family protein, partial [Chloroflexota bacterium]|nr:alkaline phosphatase family protein [Chloroflexota bacterium]